MVETIFSFVGANKLAAAASGGVVLVIINLLLSKLTIDEKVRQWTKRSEIAYEKWLDKILLGWDMIAYNFGVFITGWQSKNKVVHSIIQKGVEPVLILIVGFFKFALVLTLQKLIDACSVGARRFIDGLRSDNQEYKKPDEDE